MPTYAETAQTMLIEYTILKGFIIFLSIIIVGCGIWWVIDRFKK